MKKVAVVISLLGLLFAGGAMAHFESSSCGSGEEPRWDTSQSGHQHFLGCKVKTVGGVRG